MFRNLPSAALGALSVGCGMLACDPGASSLTALPLPAAAPRAAFALFPAVPARALAACGGASAGCVSSGAFAACGFTLACDEAAGAGGGFVGLDGAGGALTWAFAGDGASRCGADVTPLRALGVVPNAPIMDIYGDLALGDRRAVSLLQLGHLAWSKSISPAARCGDALAAISVSNTSRLMLSIGTPAEVFGYYADGVPVAEVVLYANATNATGAAARGPAPAPAPAPPAAAAAPALRARVRDIPAANGKAVPISQQVSNGLRFVYVCRFHACNTTSGAWRADLLADRLP